MCFTGRKEYEKKLEAERKQAEKKIRTNFSSYFPLLFLFHFLRYIVCSSFDHFYRKLFPFRRVPDRNLIISNACSQHPPEYIQPPDHRVLFFSSLLTRAYHRRHCFTLDSSFFFPFIIFIFINRKSSTLFTFEVLLRRSIRSWGFLQLEYRILVFIWNGMNHFKNKRIYSIYSWNRIRPVTTNTPSINLPCFFPNLHVHEKTHLKTW